MLSRYFSLDELTASQIAVRKGISNIPGPAELENLRNTAQQLDLVREALGHPVLVSSGYRCARLNKSIGGSKTSAHMFGLAVDFTCPRFGTPLQVAQEIARMPLEFDQLIHEFGAWVHLGFAAPGKVGRRQILTIDHAGTRVGLK